MRPALQGPVRRNQGDAADMIIRGKQTLHEGHERGTAVRLNLTFRQFSRRRVRHLRDCGKLYLDRCGHRCQQQFAAIPKQAAMINTPSIIDSRLEIERRNQRRSAGGAPDPKKGRLSCRMVIPDTDRRLRKENIRRLPRFRTA